MACSGAILVRDERTLKLIFIIFLALAVIPSAYAEGMRSPTSSNSVDVSVEPLSEAIVDTETTQFRVTFLEPGTNTVQQHVDYDFVIEKNGRQLFSAAGQTGQPYLHTNEGIVDAVPYKFEEQGQYSIQVTVSAIRFIPLDPETATFQIMVTPEFPFALLVAAASLTSIIIATTTLRHLRRPSYGLQYSLSCHKLANLNQSRTCDFPMRSVFAAIIRDRKLVAMGIMSAVTYVIAYMLITGAAVYMPKGIPEFTRNTQGLEAPMLKATWSGVYFIPSENLGSFLTYDAIIFLGITSALFGLSIPLVILNRRMETSCSLPSMGLLGGVPAVFTTFSCCGGGMLLLALGPAAFGLISMNSPYFLAGSIAAMSGGTILLAKRADQKAKSLIPRT